MKLGAERLKAFNPDDLRRLHKHEPQEDETVLAAAQDAGISLKIMRKEARIPPDRMADLLGISRDDLKKAERGQLVERAQDGRLVDLAPVLLIRVARITDRKSIPLP